MGIETVIIESHKATSMEKSTQEHLAKIKPYLRCEDKANENKVLSYCAILRYM